MLIVALVMAVIGLAALVTAVVTGNEAIAWVCIGASVIGVVLLIVDALRERQRHDAEPAADDETTGDHEYDAEYPEEQSAEEAPGPDDSESEGETPEERSDSETKR
jgi:hypothetical protein